MTISSRTLFLKKEKHNTISKKIQKKTYSIAITGTPGTGKTTLAKILAKHFKGIHVTIDKINALYPVYDGFDTKRNCKIVSLTKYRKGATIFIDDYLKKHTKKDSKKYSPKIFIFDSHISHTLPAKKIIACIVCKAPLKILQKRLQKRKYTHEKVRENLDAEIFSVCETQAIEQEHSVLIYTQNKKVILSKIGQILRLK